MTQESDRPEVPEIEDTLKQFRPVGPPADLRARARSAERQTAPARRCTSRRIAFIGGALAAAAIVVMEFRTEPNRQQGFVRAPGGPRMTSGSPASALTSGERATFQ